MASVDDERVVTRILSGCRHREMLRIAYGDIVREQGQIEVGCDFCGQQERFDAVDVARLFTPAAQQSPQAGSVQ